MLRINVADVNICPTLKQLVLNPTEVVIRRSFQEVLDKPKNDDGFTCIVLSSDDGWTITAYGTDLIALDYQDDQKHFPSQLTHLDKEFAIKILCEFASNLDISAYAWSIRHG